MPFTSQDPNSLTGADWMNVVMGRPRVADNDKGVITVSVDGHRVCDWIYADDAERRRMMSEARWYVEGWCDGRDAK
jgi:hypothetical protein